VIGTSGRGFWILDDLTPVQKARQEINNAVATLFEPRATYRLVSRPPGFMNTPTGFGGGFGAGGRGSGGAQSNPATAGGGTAGEVIRSFPTGAYLQYFLKDAGPVTITITSAEGRFVNKLTANGAAGMNNLRWNLRYAQGPRAVELRTTPETYPQVWQEPRFQGRQTRGIFH
jgi:hypothetical protein